jgi:uncharacterized repeat protein (TIGR01451 family)
MNGKTAIATLCAVSLMTLMTAGAYAADKACVELKTTGESEREFVENGQKVTRLVAIDKAVPGDQIVWTITATNVCKTPTDNVVIANPVPEHMTYVANSAMGTGAEITYSLDGKEFKSPAELQMRAADGTTRAVRTDEYRAIRWTYKNAFAPGATAFVRYRAVVK